MAASSTAEARTQALSEVVERYVKFRVIRDGLCLPDVPDEVIARYPQVAADMLRCARPASVFWSRTRRSASTV